MCVTLLGILILSKLAHPLNAELPIAIKLVDNVTDCKYEHPSKALVSMCVTLLGILILSKLAHPLKAANPIVIKLVDKVTDRKDEQFSNA